MPLFFYILVNRTVGITKVIYEERSIYYQNCILLTK